MAELQKVSVTRISEAYDSLEKKMLSEFLVSLRMTRANTDCFSDLLIPTSSLQPMEITYVSINPFVQSDPGERPTSL